MKYTGLIRSTFKLLCSQGDQVSGCSRLSPPLAPLRCVSTTTTLLADADETSHSTHPAHIREKCMNQVTLMGRVGRDPEKRGTDDRCCMVFSLATNTYWKEDDKFFEQRTDWHRVAVFKPGVREGVEKQVSKGSRVLVTGKIAYDAFQDASGVRHKTTTILADNVYFLTPGKDYSSEQNPEYSSADRYLKVNKENE